MIAIIALLESNLFDGNKLFRIIHVYRSEHFAIRTFAYFFNNLIFSDLL